MTLRHIQARLGMERKPDENLLKNKRRIPPNIAQNSCENHPWASQPSPNDTSITTACTNFIAYGRQLASRICLHCAMRLALCSVPDSAFASDDTMRVINVPHCDAPIAPIIYTIPLQLLSYYVALIKGTDVDQPRNLAKSVTVE